MKYVSKELLLNRLPPYRDKWVTVTPNQSLDDLIEGIKGYHKAFEPYYDRIGGYFVGRDIAETCDNLYYNVKRYIRYKEETKDWQSSAVPNGMLLRGQGDCKHYASFIAGCLDAINRSGAQAIDWCYYFASYKLGVRDPYHVFVIAFDEKGNEIWIDPTPGSAGENPVWEIRLKP